MGHSTVIYLQGGRCLGGNTLFYFMPMTLIPAHPDSCLAFTLIQVMIYSERDPKYMVLTAQN